MERNGNDTIGSSLTAVFYYIITDVNAIIHSQNRDYNRTTCINFLYSVGIFAKGAMFINPEELPVKETLLYQLTFLNKNSCIVQ